MTTMMMMQRRPRLGSSKGSVSQQHQHQHRQQGIICNVVLKTEEEEEEKRLNEILRRKLAPGFDECDIKRSGRAGLLQEVGRNRETSTVWNPLQGRRGNWCCRYSNLIIIFCILSQLGCQFADVRATFKTKKNS